MTRYSDMVCTTMACLSLLLFGCGNASPWDGLPWRDAGDRDTALEVGDTESGFQERPSGDADTDSGEADTGAADSETVDAGEAPLMPHTVGSWWIFRYTHLEDADFGACAAGLWTSGILEMTVLDGIDTYTYLSACSKDSAQAEAMIQFEGDKSVVVNFGAPFVMTDTPVADGHTWTVDFSAGPKTYRWDHLGKVTVPAGTFDHCWDRVDEANDDHLVYCRGVGRVMGRTRNAYQSELVDYYLEDEQ